MREAIAAKLNVPVDSVVVDFDKGETVDYHLLGNFTGDDLQQTRLLKEEKSGKSFIVTYKEFDVFVEFAPDQETATENAPAAEMTETPVEEISAE